MSDKLDMHCVGAKFVPRLLTVDQKHLCWDKPGTAATGNDNENFRNNITTGNETWVYGSDIETKVQSSQWVADQSSRPKKHA